MALVVAARKLYPYFLAHPIKVLTSYYFRQVLQRSDVLGRLGKWSIELGEFNIEFKCCTLMKGKELAEFVAEFTNKTSGKGPVKWTSKSNRTI